MITKLNKSKEIIIGLQRDIEARQSKRFEDTKSEILKYPSIFDIKVDPPSSLSYLNSLSTTLSSVKVSNELSAELFILNERYTELQKHKTNVESLVNEQKLQLVKIDSALKNKENETFLLKKELKSTKETYELIKSRQVSLKFYFKR